MSLGTLKLASLRAQKIPARAAADSAGARFRLDAGKQPLAEFVVGDAEHRAVAHAVHADQRVLDLGRIDVDAARDHHVALAVAQEQIAVGVEIADVADADEAVAAGLGARLGLAVIVEIRRSRSAA